MSPRKAATVSGLAEAILRHRRLYFAGRPEISDQEFDAIEEKLRAIAPEHPVLQSVGAIATASRKVTHDRPMLSLNKTYREQDLLAWVGQNPVVGMLKIDGNSLSIIYENSQMQLAKTRGDGRVGEDVTEKVKWVPCIASRIEASARVEVRGELYCSDEQFLKLADEMSARGLDRPSSPRNIVAGVLGRKSDIDLANYFNFFAFDIITEDAGSARFSSEMEKFEMLQGWGFMVPEPKLLKEHSAVTEYLRYVQEVMTQGAIGCDGAVFSFNDLALHEKLGSTSHHPRYKLSFKWQGATAISRIDSLVWATSRHGVVTPVAVIDPVPLSGATITNITLHNAALVKAYNLKPGDTIELVRSGEVIPKFLRVVTAGEGQYQWPAECLSCASELVYDGVRLKCPNEEQCPAQQTGSILNWIKVVGIDDISDKRLEAMIDSGLVAGIADLYRIGLEELLRLPLTKERMAKKMLKNIEGSRSLPLSKFLQGLGIPGAGLTTWEKIVSYHAELEDILKLTPDDLVAIDGFAEKSANQIVGGLAARRNLIEELISVGVSPKEESAASGASNGSLAGAHLAITGVLSTPRSQLEKLIKEAGGKPVSAVSSNTTAVVTNDPESNSSKMRKAREIGIPIWSEAMLLERIAGSD